MTGQAVSTLNAVQGDQELAEVYGTEVMSSGRKGGAIQPIAGEVAPSETGSGRQQLVKLWVRRIAWVLDESIEVPILGRRIGLDGIIGLIPVVGDSATLAASVAVIVSGVASGASAATITRMVLNTLVDAVVGAVPVAGQIWDFFYKANTRNLRLLEADLDDREATKRSSTKVLIIGGIIVAVVVVSFVIAVGAILSWLF